MTDEHAPLKSSFEAIFDAHVRVLVLGSLPGERSLTQAQYYAHPRNQVWKLMAAIVGDSEAASEDYHVRLAALLRGGIGLWDVVRTARRSGSLDINIRGHEPNALREFAAGLPNLKAIAFNGARAAAIGRKEVEASESLALIDLPSSSPANTMAFERKRDVWLKLGVFLRP